MRTQRVERYEQNDESSRLTTSQKRSVKTDASLPVLYVSKIEAQYGRSISVDRLLQNLEVRATWGNAIG